MARKLAKAQAELIADMRKGGTLFKMIGSTNYTLRSHDGYNLPVQYKTHKKLVELGLLHKEIDGGLTELGKTMEI